jgi:hypothetical protein
MAVLSYVSADFAAPAAHLLLGSKFEVVALLFELWQSHSCLHKGVAAHYVKLRSIMHFAASLAAARLAARRRATFQMTM